MTTNPGEVYMVDLGLAAKFRPMLVVSRKDPDAPRALSICAPITTSNRSSQYEVFIGKPKFLSEQSYVNVQGLQAIEHHELKKRIGFISSDQMSSVKEALIFALDLGNTGEQGAAANP